MTPDVGRRSLAAPLGQPVLCLLYGWETGTAMSWWAVRRFVDENFWAFAWIGAIAAGAVADPFVGGGWAIAIGIAVLAFFYAIERITLAKPPHK
jgi:hypothetical protein